MTRIPLALAVSALWLAAPAPAQQDPDTFIRVQLRVSAVTDGGVVVDRGARDLIENGDRVLLFPRRGGMRRAIVVQVDDRSAVIRLDEGGFVPDPGTRGEVLVPRARVPGGDDRDRPDAPPPGTVPPDALPPDAPPPDDPGLQDRSWTERNDGWQEGMPLLAKVRPVQPAARSPLFSGRVWSLGDLVGVPEPNDGAGDRFANSVLRAGADLRLDNPFGAGGRLRFDGELNHFTRADETDGGGLLVRTLSYRLGGDRFAPNGFEIGRFLQSGMPEFGTLDGVEYVRRTGAGHRFGASIGFLPEPDDDLDTGTDFQLAGFFHYAADDLERLTFDIGYQKSFHDSATDRDLFVLKSRYVPGDGWDLIGTAWIDYYYGGDDAKGDGFELTQGYFAATRRFEDHSGFEVAWRRHGFPLTLRDEFLPTTIEELVDARSDRVSLEGWTGPDGTARLHGYLFWWDAEDGDGAGAELGAGFDGVLFDDDVFDVTLFGTLGEFVNVGGVRVSLGRPTAAGRWDLFYELANHHLLGRDDDGDDLLQHRLRFNHAFLLGSAWSASLHGEALLYDDDLAWSAGFHVQKTF